MNEAQVLFFYVELYIPGKSIQNLQHTNLVITFRKSCFISLFLPTYHLISLDFPSLLNFIFKGGKYYAKWRF